jgi:Pyruvate/2-oxoacid:ferredoxin oxidoreductase delta subunit
MFNESFQSSGSNKNEISRADVDTILNEARDCNLVARPFRNDDRTSEEGICFCCNDCCEYFSNPSEVCDKGAFIERTDFGNCNDCGVCADVCYFNARFIKDDKLSIRTENCYGCGLCVDICPGECIEMVVRKH